MNRRLINYSLCIGIVVTAISFALYRQGGELVLWPGLLCQVLLNGILLFIPTGDDFYTLPSFSYLIFNTLFYALVVFATIFSITWMKANWKD